jgi:hypothetical protein
MESAACVAGLQIFDMLVEREVFYFLLAPVIVVYFHRHVYSWVGKAFAK